MLVYADLAPQKRAFIFEFDGVLYPERDFYLQIYYLFANFIEYVETVPPASDLLALMQKVYDHHGPELVFERAVAAFGLDRKYQENLDRLLLTAQLPLKLELHQAMLTLLQEVVMERKQLYIWTKGIPEGQLNKIRQTDWKGLEKYLRVYFDGEYAEEASLKTLLTEQSLIAVDVLMIGHEGETEALAAGIDFIHFADFLT